MSGKATVVVEGGSVVVVGGIVVVVVLVDVVVVVVVELIVVSGAPVVVEETGADEGVAVQEARTRAVTSAGRLRRAETPRPRLGTTRPLHLRRRVCRPGFLP